jgi:cyclohexanone monooxygenase
MRDRELRSIEADPQAESAWVEHVNEVAEATLLPQADSWYMGANIPGKPRVFLPLLGFPDYIAKCEEVAANDYEGFLFS